jgi:hypothetical protein
MIQKRCKSSFVIKHCSKAIFVVSGNVGTQAFYHRDLVRSLSATAR